jgi:hypothetical protein
MVKHQSKAVGLKTTSCQYYGFMQGPYFEGIRAANGVVQCFNGSRFQDTVVGKFDILLGCNGL